VAWFPPDRSTHIFNTFLQDEITLVRDRLKLTLGSKFEYNDYTRWEIQPSGRLLWTPQEAHSIWASVSRAVRTPSRADNDARVTTGFFPAGSPPFSTPIPAASTFDGNPQFRSEILTAYELGYRVQPHHNLSLDLALFYNDYDRLRSFEMAPPDLSAAPAYIRFPFLFSNRLKGETYGGELAVNLQVSERWQLRASYSYLQMQLHRQPGSQDTTEESIEGYSPHHHVTFRSLLDLPWNLQFDTTVRYVDSLPSAAIGSYVGLDLRLGWKPFKDWDISIVGQNLLDNHHPEFPPAAIQTPQAEIERAVYGKITFRF
jgi:iron complex outermembrane receptor protein